ncbi:MAG TPA: hypothetical protein VGR35_06940 [Tepidisphaeraceae bacterium]|nr:hypothetical protein [Tepidisphaeraceae bacterium]
MQQPLESLCSTCHKQEHRQRPRSTAKPARQPTLGRTLEDRVANIIQVIPQPETRRLCWEVVRQAILELVPQGQRGRRQSPGRISAVLERALHLLHELDVDTADQDDHPNVHALLMQAFKHQVRTYDRKKAGDDAWHDDRDLIESHKIWAHRSNVWIGQYTKVPAHIVREAGARAHVVRVKQIITRDGAASVAAIQATLAEKGLPHDRPFVAALVRMMTDMRLITCTDDRYWPGRCQRWGLAGRSWDLPFVRRWIADQHPRREVDMVEWVAALRDDSGPLLYQEYMVDGYTSPDAFIPAHTFPQAASTAHSCSFQHLHAPISTHCHGGTAHMPSVNQGTCGSAPAESTIEVPGHDWDGTPGVDQWAD